MKNILNYIKINDNISTSGQPTQEEFEKIANDGFEVVINLALSSAKNALENEDKIVTNLGLTYIHIPVDFENPSIKQLNNFVFLLNSCYHTNKVWIHCAKNYRVTAFMYVFHKYLLHTPFGKIDLSMFEQWSPSKKWQELMKIDEKELFEID